jgi:hypothetical protein
MHTWIEIQSHLAAIVVSKEASSHSRLAAMVFKQTDLIVIHRAPHIAIQERRPVWSRYAQELAEPVSQLAYDHKAVRVDRVSQGFAESLVIGQVHYLFNPGHFEAAGNFISKERLQMSAIELPGFTITSEKPYVKEDSQRLL